MMITAMTPLLLVVLSSWSLSVAEPCDTVFKQKNSKLQGHVNETMPLSSADQCIEKCSSKIVCNSINFYPGQSLCELNNANHLSNPESLVYSPGSHFVNYPKRRPDKCSDKLCSEPLICVIDRSGQSYKCLSCQDALGMESRGIPNSAITASSSYKSTSKDKYTYLPSDGRLRNTRVSGNFSKAGCWASKDGKSGEYLQVDLGKVMILTKVATQGNEWNPILEYVRNYSIQYSFDNLTWENYMFNNAVKVFSGNINNASIVVTNTLPYRLVTRHVRVVVKDYKIHSSLRIELYGCPP